MEYTRLNVTPEMRQSLYQKRARVARVRARYVFLLLLLTSGTALWMDDGIRPQIQARAETLYAQAQALIEENESTKELVIATLAKLNLQ